MEYYGIIKKQKLWIKLSTIILGIYIIYNTIISRNWGYFLIGFIVILANFCDKKHIISEKGVDILYIVCGIEFHNMWNYKEINKIYIDSKKSMPNVELHISKNLLFRRFILSAEDASNALNKISKINSDISIKGINTKNK